MLVHNFKKNRFTLYILSILVLCLLAFAYILRVAFINSRLITDRSKWPEELEALVIQAELTESEIDNVEVWKEWDGLHCRMKATPSTIKLVHQQWYPIDEVNSIEQPQKIIRVFWQNLPAIWVEKQKPRNTEFYASRNWDPGDEGRANYMAMYDKDHSLIFIWFIRNF